MWKSKGRKLVFEVSFCVEDIFVSISQAGWPNADIVGVLFSWSASICHFIREAWSWTKAGRPEMSVLR